MWLRTLLLSLAAMALAPPALARQAQQFGDYVVHYSAVLTSTLAPSVARTYGITRSDRRGLLTVSVEKRSGKGQPQPVAAQLTVHAANLARQTKNVDMRAIHEGAAVYYIGSFPVARREIIDFDISVAPKGAQRRFDARYRERFVAPETTETQRRLQLK